jgi:hypothetical protein
MILDQDHFFKTYDLLDLILDRFFGDDLDLILVTPNREFE